jgi:hypothetical protein
MQQPAAQRVEQDRLALTTSMAPVVLRPGSVGDPRLVQMSAELGTRQPVDEPETDPLTEECRQARS